jgi:hypothetical protein
MDATTKAGLTRPVGISRQDELVAYLVSKHDIDKLFEKIEELEDQVWLKEAELAEKEGFVAAAWERIS